MLHCPSVSSRGRHAAKLTRAQTPSLRQSRRRLAELASEGAQAVADGAAHCARVGPGQPLWAQTLCDTTARSGKCRPGQSCGGRKLLGASFNCPTRHGPFSRAAHWLLIRPTAATKTLQAPGELSRETGVAPGPQRELQGLRTRLPELLLRAWFRSPSSPTSRGAMPGASSLIAAWRRQRTLPNRPPRRPSVRR